MSNPYAPPAPATHVGHDRKVHSPGQVAWASFLGFPLAGAVLMAANHRIFGDPESARSVLCAGGIATAAIVAAALFLPDNIPGFVFPAAYTYLVYLWAKSTQGGSVGRHLASGRPKASSWVATGIGLVCSIGLLTILLAVALVIPESWLGE